MKKLYTSTVFDQVAVVAGGMKRNRQNFQAMRFAISATVCTTTPMRVLIYHTGKNGKAERKETGTNYDCLQRLSVKEAEVQRSKARMRAVPRVQ
jgi:hypothetical protein